MRALLAVALLLTACAPDYPCATRTDCPWPYAGGVLECVAGHCRSPIGTHCEPDTALCADGLTCRSFTRYDGSLAGPWCAPPGPWTGAVGDGGAP